MIKRKLKLLARTAAKSDLIWGTMWPFVRIATRLSIERKYWLPLKNSEAEKTLKGIFSDLKVRSGPFKGMLYPEFQAHGSYIFPKLLGSYEQELHPIIEKLCQNDYTEILDIGCAEGYYAVGLALRFPKAKVYAYDVDEKALNSCIMMAKANNVSDRMVFETYCDTTTILKLNFTKGLIICDCEGYELCLFTEKVVNKLSNCDLLIELHDCLKVGITENILTMFCNTHSPTLIDVQKRSKRKYVHLRSLNNFISEYALYEGRPYNMQWVYLAANRSK